MELIYAKVYVADGVTIFQDSPIQTSQHPQNKSSRPSSFHTQWHTRDTQLFLAAHYEAMILIFFFNPNQMQLVKCESICPGANPLRGWLAADSSLGHPPRDATAQSPASPVEGYDLCCAPAPTSLTAPLPGLVRSQTCVR